MYRRMALLDDSNFVWRELQRLGFDAQLCRVMFATPLDAVRALSDWSATERRLAVEHAVQVYRQHRLTTLEDLVPSLVGHRASLPPQLAATRSPLAVRMFVASLVAANRRLTTALAHIDWRVIVPGSVAERLTRRRALLLEPTCTEFLHQVLDATAAVAQQPTVTIDRIALAAMNEKREATANNNNNNNNGAGVSVDASSNNAMVNGQSTSSSSTSSSSLSSSSTHTSSSPSTAFGVAFAALSDVSPARLRPPRPRGSAPHYALQIVFKGEHVAGEAGYCF